MMTLENSLAVSTNAEHIQLAIPSLDTHMRHAHTCPSINMTSSSSTDKRWYSHMLMFLNRRQVAQTAGEGKDGT